MASVSDSMLLEKLNKLERELELLRAEREDFARAGREERLTKELPGELRDERENFADDLPVPGRDAPTFNLVNDFLALGVIPWADPLVPSYLLDKNYRIVDWNTAFSLAYDRTMEGRRGQSILEWVYFLDNYEQSLTQAAKDFADPNNLPKLHIETIEYTSPRYGPVTAAKRAYQIPKDNGEMLGWLVTLEVKFTDLATALGYKRDLFETLRSDMTWSEYALSYDSVLLASSTYLGLLQQVLGEQVPAGGEGTLTPLRRRSRILDLGAGTGNASKILAEQQRGHVIFALENNRMMLDMLREKCAPHLRADDNGPGILAIKQDVNVLFGLPDGTFDCAILNNVAYALEDPVPCFRQVREALKPTGEIRVSGPKKNTDLKILFQQIGNDLESSGRMAELHDDFDRVREINHTILASSLYRWTVDDMKQMLLAAGFREITYATDAAYAGQAMIVTARK
ncbi:MAG: class I SAM-dependent methyltransferase [Planctomycetota bacterium]|nr:class I SAM-dependent methyltransferase [Planctomycetota bacterium]